MSKRNEGEQFPDCFFEKTSLHWAPTGEEIYRPGETLNFSFYYPNNTHDGFEDGTCTFSSYLIQGYVNLTI